MDKHLGFGSVSATDGTLVVPPEVRRELGLDKPDAVVEFVVREGEVVLLPRVAVHPNDVWFWEEGQQQAEQEADEELAAGEINAPMTGEEFLSHLEEVTGEKTSEEP
ncbi:bifunctional DNA-binding transcriptional regulator/antitoxin component of YhaV-PrlF toxin-antitoxin module [Lipingzhangella halophila]|uniref:Bifunctional DNA-binding transcriptional regulator/antitoxin component of YhaV-PrlF toxin-antitoxin module n=1 Tax=Lipingzhangella halophila TaxID=1783352 RepID=A0A7W7W0L6_9ACTN|nr:AbrB/MazE/SpoVT family DNA-binding domain-containing protein [Lipingzhangella halophila]MBB4930042.1 bifunctional DNA-binding transcriptional regulator/antitoxin component of YhaV-PrlF toxin-antitoxin module [Lipingzhangella halophila]